MPSGSLLDLLDLLQVTLRLLLFCGDQGLPFCFLLSLLPLPDLVSGLDVGLFLRFQAFQYVPLLLLPPLLSLDPE